MQLPSTSASYLRRVRFGLYVARRLRTAKRSLLSQDAEASAKAVKEAGRAWEDAVEAVDLCIADRDAADTDLDTTAQETRLSLASRGLTATKEAPYNKIFHSGIEYYTAAPLAGEVTRYTELKERLLADLEEKDLVRVVNAPRLEAGIKAFQEAERELIEARNKASIANSNLSAAEDAWKTLMEKIYGLLASEVGRAKANRYFPKVRTLQDEREEE